MTNMTMIIFASLLAAALSLAALASPAWANHGTPHESSSTNVESADRPALMMPMMDPARGRALFASKGCVVCHSINGIGGEDASPLDVSQMPGPMDAFEFAARMWRGAPGMIAMQQMELGAQIELTGEELADIIAFAHSSGEQAKFSEADIPEHIREIMSGHDDEHSND
jgi:cytochrome c